MIFPAITKRAITILEPKNISDEYLEILVKYIIWCTYHFPYTNWEITKDHIEKWKKMIIDLNINIVLFDHTHYNDMKESHDASNQYSAHSFIIEIFIFFSKSKY